MHLHEFIAAHRDAIIERARQKVAMRSVPLATKHELTSGVPLFLTELGQILEREASSAAPDDSAIGRSATRRGRDLLAQGFSIAQVVHDYGDICQAITELASDLRLPVSTDDFHTLNRCLDNAIAGAVTEYSRQRDVDLTGAELRRLGYFAHELRNHLNTAMLAFQALKSGRVGITGSTIGVLERSLLGLGELIGRSVSEVRLAAGTSLRERVRVAEFIEETEITAAVEAADRGIQFSVGAVDTALAVNVDRHLFASAISNLLHNAFKYSRVAGKVKLSVTSDGEHVTFDIEDECGGLQPGVAAGLFQPFEKRGQDRSGLGLGLSISRQAIEADGGTISVRDMPGIGCVFTVAMPLAHPDPVIV